MSDAPVDISPGIRLMRGDCLSAGPIPCDLIIADPPYHRVKSLDWDRQWDSATAYLDFIGTCADAWKRDLAANGSLYCFASPAMAARVECVLAERFNVLNSITWAKPPYRGRHAHAHKARLRAYFRSSERIVFAEQYGADTTAKGEAGYAAKCDEARGFVFEPLRAYLDGERERAGFDRKMCDAACGNQMAGHYFSRVQWMLPTRANYEKLREAFNRTGGDYLRREYEDLRREYEDLRREYEDLRRPFSVSAAVPYTDVWTFPTVQAYPGKHPCEKPLGMVLHMIQASTRPGAVVFDPFAGSAVVGIACMRLGRQYVGVEQDGTYFDAAARRLSDYAAEPSLFDE